MRDSTPPYRLEMSGSTPWAWYVKGNSYRTGYGQPTLSNLKKVLVDYAKSLELGGVNYHITKAFGYVPYPTWAKVIRQSDHEVMASWRQGDFEIYS